MKNTYTTSILNYASMIFSGHVRSILLMVTLLFVAGQEISAQAPGGISSGNLRMWLKADKGTSTTTNGTNISYWRDQTGNGIHANQTTTTKQPSYEANSLNFNPGILFGPSTSSIDHMIFSTTILPNETTGPYFGATPVIDKFSIFYVVRPRNTPGFNTIFTIGKHAYTVNPGGNPPRALMFEYINASATYQKMYTLYEGGTLNSSIDAPISTSPMLFGANMNMALTLASKDQMYLQGKMDNSATISTRDVRTTSGGALGAYINTSNVQIDLSGPTYFEGRMHEIVLYRGKTATERDAQRIQSYLALKYGITLSKNNNGNGIALESPNSGNVHEGDYVLSNGTVAWDASANSAYHRDIAGIGRDDISTLNQKQSKSSNTGSIVSMGIGNITYSNANNTNTIPINRSALVWGHNTGNLNASTVNIQIGSSGIMMPRKRINRTWKVVESGGDIPTVRVAVQNSALSSLGGLLAGEYYVLVVADNAALTTNVQHIPMDAGTINVAGQASRSTTYDFNGIKYFTFAKGGTHNQPLHMVFDGVNDAIAVDKNVTEGGTYTLMAWVKPIGPNALNGNRTILAKHNGTNGYKLAIKNDNTVVFTLGGTPILNSTVALPNGVWHHLTVTYNGSTAKLYIDGVLADSGAASPSTAANAYFAMGAVYETASPTNLFKGNLDEVRVFNKVLSQDQFRFIINQEIIKDGTAIKGAIIPTSISKYDISGLPYNKLAAYFNMNVYGLGTVIDVSNNAHRGYIAPTMGVNLNPQSPPLPYRTRANGSWNAKTIWSASSDVYIPGSASIVDPNITVDWNIVETTNNVTMNNSSLPNGSNNRTLLSLEVQSNTLSVANASALSITHNLSLYGKIDLKGEAQLIQTNDSDLDTSSPGSIERDQQGTYNKYTYNYWSSPVGALGTLANNQAISLKNVLMDGTSPNAPQTINWTSSYSAASPSSPITMSSYWVYSYLNSAWSQVRETGTIQPGVGFTSKGVGTGINTDQNYVFVGKPNNGNISVPLNAGKEYLVGNPYPSALDANQFIDDNIAVIEGTLYFWEHWGGGSHIQREYQGGYATLTKAGGVKAIVHPKVSDLGGTVGTKEPKQFIPVAQGFLVNAVNGGTLKFNNGQRVFKTEGTASVFLRAAAPVKEQAKVATEDTRMKIWLKIKAGTGVERELLLAFDTNTTVGYDNGYDGAIADAHTSDHYWPLGDRKLVINALPQWSEDLEVPVGLISEKPGSSEFFISRLENVPESTPLYILDKDTGLTHDLRAANVVLPITQGEFNNRFQLVFKPSVSLSNTQEEIQQDFQIITKDKGIEIVNHKGLQIQQVKVHNIIGQQILEQKHGLDKGKSTTIALEVATGVYLVTVATPNGTWTKKVLMQ